MKGCGSFVRDQRDADGAEDLGVVVVGCGYWGINYVRVFSEITGARVVAICDPRQDRLREVGRRFPEAILTTVLEDALQLEGVDAAIVCTGATTHYEVARRCVMAGKHVLVEKPVATTVTDAQALLDLAEAQGVTLMVGHTFLYNSGVRKVKDYIVRADLGHLRYLYSRRTNLGPIRQDVNAIWDLAPHDVSIFNYLLDSEPQWVSAVGIKILQNSREDVGFISLGYPGGIVGNIHVSWADPNKVRELVVVGSEKRVAFDDINVTERVKVFEKGVTAKQSEASSYGEYHFLMRDGDIVSPKVEVSEPLKNQCRHFLDCINQVKRPLTDGLAGLAVVRVMAAIDRSLEQNGVPVSVDSSKVPAKAA
jgi:predicted dehydrogenase